MNLQPSPMALIKSGKKTIELRLYDEKRRNVKIGDTIKFISTENPNDIISGLVENLFIFKSFAELYENLPLMECGYIEEDIDTASPEDMNLYYSKEKQSKYGVVGIKIKLL